MTPRASRERMSEMNKFDMMTALESRRRGKHDLQTLVALGELHSQRCGEWAVKTHTEPEVVLQPVEVELRDIPHDFARVVEKCGVQKTIDHDPPLGRQQHAVAIAEPP